MRDLEDILEAPAERIATFVQRHGVTLLAILVFNMLIVVVLMSIRLVTTVQHETPVTLLFEEEASADELEKATQEYEALLRQQAGTPPRNIAIDASQPITPDQELNAALSDDKHTNAAQIYEEMTRIRSAVAATRAEAQALSSTGDVDLPPEEVVKPANTQVYKGPSVLRYALENRTPVRLPVPAYKCLLGGIVVVDIWVNKTGGVVRAEVAHEVTHRDQACLHEAAIEAALRSRFNASPTAPDPQQGRITYEFVQQ